jgi:polyphosphate kinase 2 (PPK2 family)
MSLNATLLDTEWARAQAWLARTHQRLCLLVEGVDGAGKTSLIRHLTRYSNPKQVRVVTLGKPTKREATEWFLQRWIRPLPASGELVWFDRSWYSPVLTEMVHGFRDPQACPQMVAAIALLERMLIDDGLMLVKLWLEVSADVQRQRLLLRKRHTLKKWKWSAMDAKALETWHAMQAQRDLIFGQTHTPWAPWQIVAANQKRQARTAVLQHLLTLLPYRQRAVVACPLVEHLGPWQHVPPVPVQDMGFMVMDGLHESH